MECKETIYTGQLTYKEIDFSFMFDGKELQLISPKGKREDVCQWLVTPIGQGTYIPNIPKMECDYLSGICNESAARIVFLTRPGSYMHNRHSILIVDVIAYIVCKYDYKLIDRISFTNPEINAIHPINESFNISLNNDCGEFNQNGVMSITTKDFDSTTTESQEFLVDERKVIAYFTVSREISTKVWKAPLSLNSSLIFEFEPTDDYRFILRLWYIAKDYLRYLCYRRDIYLPTGKLSAPYTGGLHREFATLYAVGEDRQFCVENIKSGRYIKQQLIAGHEGQILSDIASNTLYLRHLPQTHGIPVDAARFVMITAAFEWEYRRNYPEGSPKSDKTIKVEQEANKVLQGLIDSSTGNLKKVYKTIKKSIGITSLESKIKQIGEDYADIIDIFGKYMYQLNGETLSYSDMGKRLAGQRNDFAHGNLDKDFNGLSLLDMVFMERILYAIQLKAYNVTKRNIQMAISDLFQHRFIIS